MKTSSAITKRVTKPASESALFGLLAERGLPAQRLHQSASRVRKPAFAPLYRYINCLMAEANGSGGVDRRKGNTMKTTSLTLLALTIGLSALNAQNDTKHASQGGSAPRQKPQPPLVVATLDANGDGIIDAAEIARASEALKTLDKNCDGKLTPDELRRARPVRAAATPS